MDSFENVIGQILARDGFWVRQSYKVRLTPADKRAIGRITSPRWEIDLVAYRPGDNLLRIVECKSYLDSRGVRFKAFDGEGRGGKRFKLFNEPETFSVVSTRLVEQLYAEKAVLAAPNIQLCLAAGKIAPRESERLRMLFEERHWTLFEPAWIHDQLVAMSRDGYDNSVCSI
ncbi:MAG: hypothetical protein KDA71_11990, partial [Planctomycetales bacterium]|nr:hypothetical protein [Planctomycetales bacterium]